MHTQPQPGAFELAGLYALGAIKNHPFVDGNQRIGYALLAIFLELNGYTLNATQLEKYSAILRVAAGELNDDELFAWIRENSTPL